MSPMSLTMGTTYNFLVQNFKIKEFIAFKNNNIELVFSTGLKNKFSTCSCLRSILIEN